MEMFLDILKSNVIFFTFGILIGVLFMGIIKSNEFIDKIKKRRKK